jgi:exopolyphosphatase/guanosine-5'-triphosphate,3'-diphosphate pyrophosphatase
MGQSAGDPASAVPQGNPATNTRNANIAAAGRSPSTGKTANAGRSDAGRSSGGRARVGDRGNWNARRAYAAIDLGTNNCRLLIAKPAADGFVVVDAFSRVVRLGEGLGQSGRLSEAAMDRAVAALSICADKLRRRHVALARSVATEACRKASNGPEFIDRVRRETGIVLDIITAEEEARLAVLGCHILLEPGDGPALIFDIGGGSTELVLVDNAGPVPDILDWMSVPWGVVTLTESEDFDSDDADARAAAYQRMRERVRDGFAAFASRLPVLPDEDRRLLGTSGTVTTLASLHLDLPCYNRDAIDGLIVPSESMRAISARLAGMSLNQRRDLPCIGKERADLVVAGCAILESILDIWPAVRLGVADRGIREGILRALMGRDAPLPSGPSARTGQGQTS